MILITGATGNLGKATINFLLTKGVAANRIAALVRNEQGAAELKALGVTIKIGDYDNYESLVDSFTGINKLLLISGSDVVNRGKQQENVVNAANRAGVKHILYTSFERKNESESSPIALVAKAHIDTENNIRASGMQYTLFRNNLYLDILPMFLGEQVLDTGIFLPAGETKAAFTLRADMAEALANVLAGSGHENKEYRFSNTANYSLQEVAEILSQLSGKEVGYTSPGIETYTEKLKTMAVPEDYISVLAGFSTAIQQGEFTSTVTDLENLLGRKPTSLKEYLQATYFLNN